MYKASILCLITILYRGKLVSTEKRHVPLPLQRHSTKFSVRNQVVQAIREHYSSAFAVLDVFIGEILKLIEHVNYSHQF